MSAYQVISVVGPTASGKSSLADALCLRLGGEVVSADSMQVYRGMDIGTAKTPVFERRVPLHCIDLVDIGQPYSAAVFAQDSHACIDGLLARDVLPVVCGGTGLYVRAALEDMGFPEGEQVENPVRERYEALAAQMGNELTMQMLCEVLDLDYDDIKDKLPDPEEDPYAVQTAINNIDPETDGDVIE